MEEYKKLKRINTLLLVLVMILSITVGVLLAMLLKANAEDAEPVIETTAAAEETTAAEETVSWTQPEIQQTVPVLPEDFCISTPYCDLYIPVKWENIVKSDAVEMDNMYAVTVLGTVADREVPLYTLLFEEGENQGMALGSVKNEAGGDVWVYLEMSEFAQDKTWSGEQYDEILAMQETVNYLLQKLGEEPAFTPAA